jgi:hypothetical protein
MCPNLEVLPKSSSSANQPNISAEENLKQCALTWKFCLAMSPSTKLFKFFRPNQTAIPSQKYLKQCALTWKFCLHCKSEGLRKYFDQVYGTLQIALVHFFGNINKKAKATYMSLIQFLI